MRLKFRQNVKSSLENDAHSVYDLSSYKIIDYSIPCIYYMFALTHRPIKYFKQL